MTKLLMKHRNRKGFTLIELIVVIAILGILAAILIPQFTGFQDKAKATQALVDAKQIATALDGYNIENSGYPAAVAQTAIPTTVPASPSTAFDKIVATSSVLSTSTDAKKLQILANGGFTLTITINSKDYVAGRANSTSPVKMS